MAQRVAEDVVRPRRLAPKVLVRVDLHGVSVFGPGDQHTLIRWEWVEGITVDRGVVVTSARDEIRLPRGAFGLGPEALAERLEQARSIAERPTVIGELSGR